MLEIISLVACGWLLMFNPTDSRNTPFPQWELSRTFDRASDCEDYFDQELVKLGKRMRDGLKLELTWDEYFYRFKCVPSDAVYPHAQPKK
jgi:hypothetical protein